MKSIQVVDSHTAGEPTRVVIESDVVFQGLTVAQQAVHLRDIYKHYLQAVVLEPRGSDVLVGAWLVPSKGADFGVVFFNNVGLLGMCGHGMMGVYETLRYLKRINLPSITVETPVGIVPVTMTKYGNISLTNVVSYRLAADVGVTVPGYGTFHGDVAWGGNWFYLVHDANMELKLANVEHLTAVAKAIKTEIVKQYPEVDHIELFSEPADAVNDSRNFVLCPGNAYDRSPCGTGTSAKLACLAAAGKLQPGELWRQESILGTVFVGSYESCDGGILPTICGNAYVTATATLLLDTADPFRYGIS